MSDSKHTPGPWEAAKTGMLTNEGGRPVMNYTGNGKRICVVDLQKKVKRNEAWQSTDHEREANVALISAAPELLAACKMALGAFENNNAIDWNELNSAIAKAERM